jgi:tetratricopeptide (TPR) repeat protein
VRMDADSGRYGMLETVKAYAREKLEASGELDGAVERHMQFFVRFAQDATPRLIGPDQRNWMLRVDVEYDNIQAAHSVCCSSPSKAMADLAFVRALKAYWITSGRINLGLTFSLEALANTGASSATFERAAGLCVAGMLYHFAGRFDDSLKLLDESVDLARSIGELRVLPTALSYASMAALERGDAAEALRFCDEGAAVALKVHNKHSYASVLNARGQVLRFVHDLSAAREPLERSRRLLMELGDEQGAANPLLNLAMVDIEEGDRVAAQEKLSAAIGVWERLETTALLQTLLDACGVFALSQGRSVLGSKLIAVSDSLYTSNGSRRDPADRLFVGKMLARYSVDLGSTKAGDVSMDWSEMGQLLREAAVAKLHY